MKTSLLRRVQGTFGTLLLIGAAIFWSIPLIWSVLIAIRPENEPLATSNIFFGSRLTLENFQSVAQVTNWGEHFYATLRFVFGVLLVQIVTITLAAYAFARMRFWGSRLFFGLILIQLMVPAAVLIVPNFATISALRLYDTMWALMLPYMGSAFGTFLMRQAFKQVPLELEDAARLDGCGWFGVLWNVYLPPSTPSLVAFSLVSVITRWNEFLWPMIVTQSSENRPLTIGLSRVLRTSEVGALYGQIMAGVLVVILPLIVLFIFFQRQFINSFVRSGLK